MISPNTPPGTQVCCINNSPGPFGPVSLKLGGYYTIDRIEKARENFAVATLAEVKPPIVFDIRFGLLIVGFGLHRFRYVDVPESLTDLLKTEKEPAL